MPNREERREGSLKMTEWQSLGSESLKGEKQITMKSVLIRCIPGLAPKEFSREPVTG